MNVYLQNLVPVDLAQCEGRTFLQSTLWGTFKSRFGWQALGFLAEWGDLPPDPLPPAPLPLTFMDQSPEKTALLVLIRRFSLKFLGPVLTFAYIPWGPELPQSWGSVPGETVRQGALLELAESLRAYLPRRAAFIRIDPPWYSIEGADQTALQDLQKPFTRAAADVQPPDTVVLDLSLPEEEILQAMKPKWRYNVRLSEKKGVRIRRAGEEELPVFYALFQETSRRDGIAIHSLDYYRTLFSLCREHPPGRYAPDIRLYIASVEGDDLSAIITLFRDTQGYYLYGASSDRKRNLMAPYGLQWQAIRDAKAAGCLEYDLFGIPPWDDPGHPMAGLYRFKTGFGGAIIHRPGSWDYTYRPVTAKLFNAAEGFRKYLRSLKKR